MKTLNNQITINSRKFDHSVHRSWKADFISEDNLLLSFRGEFEKEVNHPQLGFIRRNTVSYEFFWKHRNYNVFRFHEPDGSFRNFYCNLALPPTFRNNVLDYVDLDIDVLVRRDFSFEILDMDEYLENESKFEYPESIRQAVKTSLAELTDSIKKKQFPFDIKL